MANTIFFGNGINRMAGGESWDKVLKRMSYQDSLPDIKSNTLKYEYIILPRQEKIKVPWTLNGRPFIAGRKMLARYVSMENHIVKRGLCWELKKQPINPYYVELSRLNADFYITTNYELFLNDEFKKLGYTSTKSVDENSLVCGSRLYANEIMTKDGVSISLWNIHGNWDNSESIMLGIKDYCDYVSEINHYINEEKKDDTISWIDLFLQTDVYFVGFALAYEEIDIWYLLTLRKRKIRQKMNDINNHIYYYIVDKYVDDKGKIELLRTMDVEVVIIPSQSTAEKTNKFLFEKLIERIGKRVIINKIM